MNKTLLSFSLLLVSNLVCAEGGRFDNEYAWLNPAEMDRTKNYEVSAGLIYPIIHIPIFGTQNFPPVGPIPAAVQNVDVKIRETYALPGGKITYRVNDKFLVGVVAGQTFLNDLTYPANSPLLYSIWRSKVNGYTIAPNMAYQVNEKFTVGFGLDILRSSAELKTNFGFGNSPIPQIPRNIPFSLKADGWQLGWHAGVTAKPWLGSYISLSYFSNQNAHIKGPASVTGPTGIVGSGEGSGSLYRPDFVRLGVFQALNEDFGLIGQLTYLRWSRFKTIVANLPSPVAAQLQGTSQLTVPLFYRNTWIAEFGARKVVKKFTLLGLVRYAQTPVNATFRNLSLPENNAWTSTIRGEYNFTDNISMFARWTHLFEFNAPLAAPGLSPGRPTLIGNATPSADILALGLTYKA